MVEIIGKDEKHIKEVSCKNCASRLRYTLKEVKSYSAKDISGISDEYHYINCPSCNQRVYVRKY